MEDPTTEEDFVEFGTLAELLVGHPIFLQAVDDVHKELVTSILVTDLDATDERELLYRQSVALRSVVATLNQYILNRESILDFHKQNDERDVPYEPSEFHQEESEETL